MRSVISVFLALVVATVSCLGLTPEKKAVQAKASAVVAEHSEKAKNEKGILGFLWDDQDKVFYSAHGAWQRNFGYNKLYDFAAQFLLLFYDTCRVKFNYEGKDWLIQFWKGQYGLILVGAEVGVYCKDENQALEHFECADDENLFSLGYTLYSYNDVLFVRTYQETWWLTGFVIGRLDKFYDRSQLSMRLRISLKDEGMKEKFIEALRQPGVGFREGNAQDKDTFCLIGNDVYLMWNTNRNKTS